MTDHLADRRCQPCEGGVEPLRSDQTAALMEALHADWSLSDDGRKSSAHSSFLPIVVASDSQMPWPGSRLLKDIIPY